MVADTVLTRLAGMDKNTARTPYRVVVGTGGIGSGISMRLEGNHLLGREETRFVTLLEGRDYCKLHNVFHYLQVLVGDEVRVLPIGKVGDDDAGSRLLGEMRDVGMDLEHVTTVAGKDTLYAIAFTYPNGDGGNLTTLHSASDDVSRGDIEAVRPQLLGASGAGIAVALPEVPLQARYALLRMAGELGFFRVATFISGEVEDVLADGILHDVDLLVLNRDEAAAFTKIDGENDVEGFARQAVELLLAINSRLYIVITAGARGSWSWDGSSLLHAPAIITEVRSTAGAGDAHLGGIISGLVRGLTLHEANRFGTLIGSMKVESQHTLNANISWLSVIATAKERHFLLPDGLLSTEGELP